ncbi:hypothetical protein [Chitinolyticbacter meiyuanensis]|uniref:hypothetical protein n=1 Tax=Chitinolyticbacter meiyuanensis TaxID=682798 RepID=UPI0011E5C19B|nr:hypothetical protein [Chitinolyticbacter meiyuanensis]
MNVSQLPSTPVVPNRPAQLPTVERQPEVAARPEDASLSQDQKDVVEALYVGQQQQNQVDIYMAVAAAQQDDSATVTVQQDSNLDLSVNINRPNGEQVYPYQSGSVLDTRA